MNKIVPYVPLLYRIKTREKTKVKLLPFLITDFIPSLLCVPYTCEFHSFWIVLLEYFLNFFIMFNIYEYGYIVNDCLTSSSKEINPTERLTLQEKEFLVRNILVISAVRLLFIIIFSICLTFLLKNITIVLLADIFLLMIYCLHNYCKDKVRYFTDFLLNMCKYIIPIMVFFSNEYIYNYLYLILMFPLCRTICYIIKKSKLVINTDLFQLTYYFFVLLLGFFIRSNLNVVLIYYVIFYLLYRLLVFVFHKVKK